MHAQRLLAVNTTRIRTRGRPSHVNRSSSQHSHVDVQIACGPPRGPTAPRPVRRNVDPLSTPAACRPGACAPRRRGLRPRQPEHGEAITSTGTAAASARTHGHHIPRIDCRARRTWPVPLHSKHVTGGVPSAAPDPSTLADHHGAHRHRCLGAEHDLLEVEVDHDFESDSSRRARDPGRAPPKPLRRTRRTDRRDRRNRPRRR